MIKLKFTAISILILLLSFSCTTNKKVIETYWVNSMKTECDAGAGKAQCLQISKKDSIEDAEWTFFYAPIEGFNFEPGLFQKIEVSKTQLNPKDVPADASSLSYKLINVLEKKEDVRLMVNDIWVATHLNGEDITARSNAPKLEINVAKMQVFGTDSCNNYTGDITSLNTKSITFGPLAKTRKMCPDMSITDAYTNALADVVTYNRENLKLTLFNSDGKEILRFKKID